MEPIKFGGKLEKIPDGKDDIPTCYSCFVVALKRTSSGERLELFVAEYLIDLNATRAAIAAGYSPKTAGQQGSRLLKNVKVVTEIAAKTKARIASLEITADKVLQELAKLAFFDPRKLFNPDGSPKQITELDDDTAAGLAHLEVQELLEGTGEQKHCYGLVKKIRIADKGINLERLGKYLNLFNNGPL